MNAQHFSRELAERLLALYGENEARQLAFQLLECITGVASARLFMEKAELSPEQMQTIEQQLKRLEKGEPIQYVLGTASFFDLEFQVSPSVLIPRPETEELVAWILEEKLSANLRILDIGTGSGCIPISIAKISQANVHAIDISADALVVARQNAKQNQVQVVFTQTDVLKWRDDVQFLNNEWDIVVSNPPYVTESEAELMHQNVLKYEPHTALFVPDQQALLFYESIAEYAIKTLKTGGLLFFEINEAYGNETLKMLQEKGFTETKLRKDLQGKDRMIKAKK